jgi:hypothetical protein
MLFFSRWGFAVTAAFGFLGHDLGAIEHTGRPPSGTRTFTLIDRGLS